MSDAQLSVWPTEKLAELCEINIGGTPSRNVPAFWADPPEGHPWLSIADIKEKYLTQTSEHISALGARSSNVKAIAPDTLVMSFKLSVGKVGIVKTPMYCNEAIAIFQPIRGRVDHRWLYFALPRAAGEAVTDTAVKGSTFNKASLARLSLSVPDVAVQAKIAEVLDTLDAAIRGTEAVVAKLRAMKQGLLHDLLTRGIDAHGDLRPPQPEAPHLYHQTPLGWLPKEWDWGRLADYCSRICVGIVIKPADHYVDEGVPTFRSANVREGYVSESDFVYISAASNAMLHKSQIRKGDILTVRTGYPGTSAVVPEKYDGCNCVDILISTPLNSVSAEFLCSWINSPFGKGQVLSGQGGLAQQHFNVGEMRELIVVKPCKKEQEEITSRIDAEEVKIQTEQNLLNKLRLQKSGLMDDLLTGRVPVTPLL